jgi:hypothetical protein
MPRSEAAPPPSLAVPPPSRGWTSSSVTCSALHPRPDSSRSTAGSSPLQRQASPPSEAGLASYQSRNRPSPMPAESRSEDGSGPFRGRIRPPPSPAPPRSKGRHRPPPRPDSPRSRAGLACSEACAVPLRRRLRPVTRTAQPPLRGQCRLQDRLRPDPEKAGPGPGPTDTPFVLLPGIRHAPSRQPGCGIRGASPGQRPPGVVPDHSMSPPRPAWRPGRAFRIRRVLRYNRVACPVPAPEIRPLPPAGPGPPLSCPGPAPGPPTE